MSGSVLCSSQYFIICNGCSLLAIVQSTGTLVRTLSKHLVKHITRLLRVSSVFLHRSVLAASVGLYSAQFWPALPM
ncbi:hypothetical protein K438DRAFT_2009727, partial [Mycena galopus ATCC 62051]